MLWRTASNSSWLSCGRTVAFDVIECETALRREAAFPSDVRGPVEAWALMRFASAFAALDMVLLLRVWKNKKQANAG
jgi:hypothetical protein